MAINPFPRITPLDIPTYLPSAARAPEGTFNNIASIGDAIGEYRTRNRLSEVAQGAIDPQTGQLDINKFAAGAALAGIDPMRALTIAEAARGRTTSENAQRALEAYHHGQQPSKSAPIGRPSGSGSCSSTSRDNRRAADTDVPWRGLHRAA